LVMALVFSLMLSGVVLAQVSQDELTAKKEAYWKTIDTTTSWGKWLSTEFRPYQDKVSQAMQVLLAPGNGNAQEGRLRSGRCFEALQKIAPPAELKKFHAKQLALYAFVSKNIPANTQEAIRQGAVIKKLNEESSQELANVLARHGVPQGVIDGFTK
jgi:hypothetical protein